VFAKDGYLRYARPGDGHLQPNRNRDGVGMRAAFASLSRASRRTGSEARRPALQPWARTKRLQEKNRVMGVLENPCEQLPPSECEIGCRRYQKKLSVVFQPVRTIHRGVGGGEMMTGGRGPIIGLHAPLRASCDASLSLLHLASERAHADWNGRAGMAPRASRCPRLVHVLRR